MLGAAAGVHAGSLLFHLAGYDGPGIGGRGPGQRGGVGSEIPIRRNGTISGIRFYKATANTGTHVGNLWSSTGTLLGTAAFTNETASGWQQVNFAAPVAITSSTVYVASYHSTAGHYSADLNYFLSSGVDNAPLHALADGVSGGDGVYTYGASSAFPNQTWSSANYWVDVVLQAATDTAGDRHDFPAQRLRERGLHSDVDCQRGELAVHLVDCQRVSPSGPDVKPHQRSHYRDAEHYRHFELHGPGKRRQQPRANRYHASLHHHHVRAVGGDHLAEYGGAGLWMAVRTVRWNWE